MRKLLVGAAALTAAAVTAIPGIADAASPPSGPSGADVRFLTENTQVDLAEITLAGIVLDRSDDPAARDLAQVTKADHTTALAKVRAIAAADNVTLPTEPNAMQQHVAQQLQTTSDVPLTYFQAQVSGHLKSISQTQHEIRSGRDAAVVDYAQGYLPVATMHLQMSRHDLRHLGRQ